MSDSELNMYKEGSKPCPPSSTIALDLTTFLEINKSSDSRRNFTDLISNLLSASETIGSHLRLIIVLILESNFLSSSNNSDKCEELPNFGEESGRALSPIGVNLPGNAAMSELPTAH